MCIRDLLRTFQAATKRGPVETPDIHTKLMSKYPQIPFRWPVLLFLGTHLASMINLVVYKDQLEMKWWGILLSTGVAAVLVLPISILVATTNQVPTSHLAALSQKLNVPCAVPSVLHGGNPRLFNFSSKDSLFLE
jgi:hypothetical protein